MTYTARQALTVALYNQKATNGGLSLAACTVIADGMLDSLTSMGWDLDPTRHLEMAPTDTRPRPWDGHACAAMLPAPYGRHCPWCGTRPALDVSHLGTEEAVFGDELDD